MRKFLQKVYLFVDKFIVTPISRFIYFFQKNIKKTRGWFDKLINKSKFILYLSLIFAVIVFLLVDYEVVTLVENQYDVITNVPVNVTYNSVSYVVEGVPETVDITIFGRNSDIYLAKQLADYQVELDLTNYEASDTPYRVNFIYVKSVDNVKYNLSPSYANVVIKEKVSEVFSLSYDILNLDSLSPELNVKDVVLDKSEVVVKGSRETLDEVSSVKALIDLKSQRFNKVGTYDMKDIKLVAYDNAGKVMKNVEIVPAKTEASIVLESYSKSIELRVNTTGTLIAGKAISSILINGKETYALKVYGEESDLEELLTMPVTIDVDKLGKETTKTYTVSVNKPAGVRYIDGDTVTVTATFADEDERTIDLGNKIVNEGLKDGLTANIISTSGASVQVKGVTSVIKSIESEDLKAYVDLEGLGKGEHEVKVTIDDDNPLVNYIVSGTIKVKIS